MAARDLKKTDEEEKLKEAMIQTANELGIKPQGIMVYQGRPYLNSQGTEERLVNKCRDENLIVKENAITRIVTPTIENSHLCGFVTTLELFNEKAFLEALKITKSKDMAVIEALADKFIRRYTSEGWASPRTCSGIAYEYLKTGKWETWRDGSKHWKRDRGQLLVENVIMMAETRSYQRVKRKATNTALTSWEEMPIASEKEEILVEPTGYQVEEEKGKKAPPRASKGQKKEDLKKDQFKDEVKQLVEGKEFIDFCKDHGILNMKEVKTMLQVHSKKEHLQDITLNDVTAWRSYIESTEVQIDKEEKLNDSEPGENGEGPESSKEPAGESSQGDLFKGTE